MRLTIKEQVKKKRGNDVKVDEMVKIMKIYVNYVKQAIYGMKANIL